MKVFVLLTTTFFSVLAGSVAGVNTAFAFYPEAIDDYVNDFAGVVSTPDGERIQQNLRSLEYQTGIEMVVVTINSTEEYNTGDGTIENFATSLFNYWGIGHRDENNGVLILVAVHDRAVRVELGEGYSSRYNSLMAAIIEEEMLPWFQESAYSRGIYEGSRAIIEEITKPVPWYVYYQLHILLGILSVISGLVGISLLRSGKKGWGWAFLALAGTLLFVVLKKLLFGMLRSGFGGGRSSGGGATGRW
ncbi:MAG: TPM domain-containing protein [bacterium]|nr:TPM domain-containing protein [bacterium]